MGNTHDILIGHFPIRCGRKLHRFGCLEINKKMLYDQFRQFISGIWNHAICNNASLFCNRDIRSSGPHIDQSDIEHSEILRDGYIDCRNWLKCHIRNRKSCLSDCRIQAVHNILRKKRHDDILPDFVCLMPLNADKQIIIEIIFHNRISDTIKLVSGIILFL